MNLIHPQLNVPLTRWIYLKMLSAIDSPPIASLTYSFAFTGFCWLAVYLLLYRRRIFLKI